MFRVLSTLLISMFLLAGIITLCQHCATATPDDCNVIVKSWFDGNTAKGFKAAGKEPIEDVGLALTMISGKSAEIFVITLDRPDVNTFFDSQVVEKKLVVGGQCTSPQGPMRYYTASVDGSVRT